MIRPLYFNEITIKMLYFISKSDDENNEEKSHFFVVFIVQFIMKLHFPQSESIAISLVLFRLFMQHCKGSKVKCYKIPRVLYKANTGKKKGISWSNGLQTLELKSHINYLIVGKGLVHT